MGTRHLSDEEIQDYLDRQQSFAQRKKNAPTKLSAKTQKELFQYQVLYNTLDRQPETRLSSTFENAILTRLSIAPLPQTERLALYLLLPLTFLLVGAFVSIYWLNGTSAHGLVGVGKQTLRMFILFARHIANAGLSLKLIGLGCSTMIILGGLDNLIRLLKGSGISKPHF